jgi:hypothetical protein
VSKHRQRVNRMPMGERRAHGETQRDRLADAYERNGGNISAIARDLGLHRRTIHHHLRKMGITKPVAGGRAKAQSPARVAAPTQGVRRFILTCAQNNTHTHTPTLANLRAFAEHYKAEMLCSSFTYNQNAYGHMAVKRGTKKLEERALWYDPEIAELLDASDRDIELAPGLVWCGRMNILPTARRPLQGFENHTGRKSGIFPHVKQEMESIASGKNEAAKFNYTTGTVTQQNYIQKREGIRAEDYHAYGGLIVEVTPRGWYVRQLRQDSKGRMYDWDLCAQDGKITKGHPVEGINWGDSHADEADPQVRELSFGKGGMLDELRPSYQFFNDILSFRRSHHELGNPHKMFERFVNGQESVEQEVLIVKELLEQAEREWCQSVVVDSNHDNMLTRWLREADYRKDPINAIFFLECQLAKYRAIKARDKNFHMVEAVMRQMGCPKRVRFLREDESFITCRDSRGGIENGMHGHLGINGAKGSPEQFTKMGRAANTGHTHSAGIRDLVFTAGTSSMLDLGYNRGPGSWSHSHIVTYKGGTRAIVTMWKGDCRGRD